MNQDAAARPFGPRNILQLFAAGVILVLARLGHIINLFRHILTYKGVFMSFKQVLVSAMFLLTVAGCAHKSEKAACACGKETAAHKCSSGHCSHEGEAKGGCEDCKKGG